MYKELKYKFGPCGLLCEKCFAFNKGPIQKHATILKENLGDFAPYAKRFVNLLHEPVFKKYPDFDEVLSLFINTKCKGCRLENCKLYSGCKVKDCEQLENIDFCFQCKHFPCMDTGFDDNLRQRWLNINNRIIETGLEKYYNEIKNIPRY